VADTQRRKRPHNPLLFSQVCICFCSAAPVAIGLSLAKSPVFTAAMVLIMNEWSYPQEHSTLSPTDNLALVYTAIDILKAQQEQ
jgi:hypothetical protein